MASSFDLAEPMSASRARIRVGVVGIGFGQQVHVPALRDDARFEVAALCASSRERAQRVADKLGIARACGDWRALVDDPTLDALTIATPPDVQAEIALAALARGKHVFCEKPLAADVATAQRLAAAAQRANVAHMVDFLFPEIPVWQQARALLHAGGIGSVRHLSIAWHVETYANRMGLSSWKTASEAGGGTLFSFVSHVFWYVEWLMGPIARLSASLWRAPGDARSGDNLVALHLELASGVPVVVNVSSNAFLGSGHALTWHGDAGTLVLRNQTADYINGFELLLGTRASQRLALHSAAPNAAPSDGRVAVVAALVRRFGDWITTGTSQRPHFGDGLRVQQLLAAAQRSGASGCRESMSRSR